MKHALTGQYNLPCPHKDIKYASPSGIGVAIQGSRRVGRETDQKCHARDIAKFAWELLLTWFLLCLAHPWGYLTYTRMLSTGCFPFWRTAQSDAKDAFRNKRQSLQKVKLEKQHKQKSKQWKKWVAEWRGREQGTAIQKRKKSSESSRPIPSFPRAMPGGFSTWGIKCLKKNNLELEPVSFMLKAGFVLLEETSHNKESCNFPNQISGRLCTTPDFECNIFKSNTGHPASILLPPSLLTAQTRTLILCQEHLKITCSWSWSWLNALWMLLLIFCFF